MTVSVNGKPQEHPEGLTIRGLIELHKLSPEKVAVEVNRKLVRTAQYDRVLSEGDEIEIVTFVGGG
jgi:sulfur carrier protein